MNETTVKINPALASFIRPVTDFFPDPDNVNDHTPADIAEIRASLEDFGQMRAIIVRSDGLIVCGNGTYQAMLLAGAAEIAAMVDDEHTPEELARFAIADNKTKEGSSLNEARLAAFVARMREENPLSRLPGFKAESLDKLAKMGRDALEAARNGSADGLDADRAMKTAPSALDSVPQRVNSGDVWQLGRHRLICGDCCSPDALSRLMETDEAAMIWSDPPYGIQFASNHYPDGNPHERIENDDTILDFLPNCLHFSAENCPIYVCAGHQNAHLWRAHLDKDAKYKNQIVWRKNNWSMGDLEGAFANQYEVIFYYAQGRPLLQNGRDKDIWDCDRVPPAYHPTTKPADLIARAIKNSTRENDIVLDPFGGSGPSLMACEATGRAARLCEISPRYCDVILHLWGEYGGTAPIRISEGLQ